MAYSIGMKVQAFGFIYYFVDHMDFYSLSVVSKVFRYLFHRFIKYIQYDISMGKERNTSIEIVSISNSYPPIPRMNFEYITENIHWRFAKQFLTSCDCNDTLCGTDNECGCCLQYGYHYKFINGIPMLNKPIQEISRIIECNELCKCDTMDCKNRVTQFKNRETSLGIGISVYLKYDKDTFWGLFTNTDIMKGQFVVEFVGEILSDNELQNRENKTYLLTVNEIITDKIIASVNIDPFHCGNIARFINHSCDENLMPHLVYSATDIPRICMFAIKNIKRYSQLTFNYGRIEPNANVASKQRCFCGSKNCQQYLPHSVKCCEYACKQLNNL